MKEVKEILESRRRQIFYMDAESYFIGTRRDNCRVLSNHMKQRLPAERDIPQCLEEIDKLDEEWTEKSVKRFNTVQEPMDRLFWDDKIKDVLECFERRIVQRFLENYVKGLRRLK